MLVRPILLGMLSAVLLSGCGDMRRSVKDVGSRSSKQSESSEPVIEQGLIREPAVAGPPGRGFYNSSPSGLRDQVERCLSMAAKVEPEGKIIAAVVPHAGYVYSGKCAGSFYRLIKKDAYDTVIILGPSHCIGFSGIALPSIDYSAYKTPLGEVPIDRRVCAELEKAGGFVRMSDVDPRGLSKREHCIEVQLPFLQETVRKFKIVPLVCGDLSESAVEKAGAAIRARFSDRTLVIVSSDFTHYGARFGYLPFRRDIKKGLYALLGRSTALVSKVDAKGFDKYLAETRDTICGRNAIRVLLAALTKSGREVKGKVLDTYTSGDVTGDYSSSVSYTAIVFFALSGK